MKYMVNKGHASGNHLNPTSFDMRRMSSSGCPLATFVFGLHPFRSFEVALSAPTCTVDASVPTAWHSRQDFNLLWHACIQVSSTSWPPPSSSRLAVASHFNCHVEAGHVTLRVRSHASFVHRLGLDKAIQRRHISTYMRTVVQRYTTPKASRFDRLPQRSFTTMRNLCCSAIFTQKGCAHKTLNTFWGQMTCFSLVFVRL